ncbi:peptidylprolyl isomerase [uncultured Paracoccus sp.]|uniref:peptidylprolyl isomerase n=1 Tax=uncultured Paracoccus sp. TaxID=189685 RepID=UPI00260D44AB|nr:peptidylprolyl isomerase [uncultured Paracoccus sp.]
MANLRTKGKSTIVWVLMGMLVLGLGGFGVTNFGGGQTEVGRVGDTKITAGEYARALQNQINAYSQQTGQPFTVQQAESIGLTQQVQSQLFTAAALSEEARKIGVSVGDQKVADTILQAPNFRGPNGQFDRTAYGEMLRRQGMDEGEFEAQIREDEARLILQRAVATGAPAPQPAIDQTVRWMLESRDVTWREITADQLAGPVERPNDETLKAWHQANAERFTAPELRKITYVWLTPDMLEGEVELDETALRAEYDRRIAEFQQPERRMIGRLVFPTIEDAEAAKKRIDAGEVPFAAVVLERGLTLDDIELGELSQEDLGGETGEAVFALEQPGVVGPFQSDLGPALFSMNAILEPVDISFDAAQDELRGEAAADRAARMIEDQSGDFEDMLASGASLEDVAEETPMELGQIDFDAAAAPQHTGIDGYQSFRERAAAITEGDFPQLYQLDDGGVFALRLDEIVPPTLKPFDEVADAVAEDWIASETHGMLLALAEEEAMSTEPAASHAPAPETEPAAEAATEGEATEGEGTETAAAPEEPEAAAPVGQTVEALTRDGWIDGTPAELVAQAFAMTEPGLTHVVNAKDRVFLVTLDAIHEADMTGEAATEVADTVRQRLEQSLQNDLFDYYVRSVQAESSIQLNQSAINAAQTMVQ